MKRFAILPLLAVGLLAACSDSIDTPSSVAPPSAAIAVTIDDANAPSGTHLQTGTIDATVSGLSVTSTQYELAGVGHINALLRVLVKYSAIVDCFNGGVNPQNPIESHVTGFAEDKTVALTSSKNGRLTVPTQTLSPTQASLAAATFCPNANWSAVIRPGSLQLVSFSLTLTFEGFTEPYISITGP